jgi:RNA polymerase sigma-70 factor (ECF subfamily)
LSDAALVRRLAEDVDDAFPAIVRAHQDRVWSLALRLTNGDRCAAEDLAADVFERAYRALSSWDVTRRRQVNLRPWLATIALNAARNNARRDNRAQPGRHLSPAHTDDHAAQAADRSELSAALQQLAPAQREAVVLRHIGGLSYAEIAEATERPIGTVKADVHRGLATLRTALDDNGDNGDKP